MPPRAKHPALAGAAKKALQRRDDVVHAVPLAVANIEHPILAFVLCSGDKGRTHIRCVDEIPHHGPIAPDIQRQAMQGAVGKYCDHALNGVRSLPFAVGIAQTQNAAGKWCSMASLVTP